LKKEEKMAGLEMGTAKAVAEAAIEIISKAHKQGWVDKLISALRKKHRVLVLGATGAGKTAFLDSLSEVVPKAINLMNRTEYVEKYHVRISKRPFILVDTPGQIPHRSKRIAAIREAMKEKSGIAGIINVVSYGYLESRAIAKPEIKSNGRVSETFLKEQRQVEIEMLDEWIPLLGGVESAGWLITVVSKADLWWRQRDKVLAHYETGPYYEALGEAQSLKPVVLPYCSIFQKFYEEGTMSGDFEDADRIQAKAQMIRTLLAAVGGKHHA
jgi:energy-coupling factor transporter ATP-binding protein EcfA2